MQSQTYLGTKNLLDAEEGNHHTGDVDECPAPSPVEPSHASAILVQGQRKSGKLLAHNVHVARAQIAMVRGGGNWRKSIKGSEYWTLAASSPTKTQGTIQS